MKNHLALVTFFCLCVSADSAVAVNQTHSTQWDRSNAMAAVRAVNIRVAVDEIGNVSSLADGEMTLKNLKQMETRSDWPMPAREAALFEFTRSLAGLPRSAVAVEVMQHLQNYQVQTWVPHEDHGSTLVPLFNIRGAATGVENGWQRTEFAIDAARLLETNPAGLVSAFMESTNHNRRSGYLDALREAELADVEAVQLAALEQFAKAPGLTPMVGLTAVTTRDRFAIQQLLINGRGAGLSSALRQLDQRLPASETASFLIYAVENAPVGNASLAIAAWWPGLRHVAAIRDLLVDELADPALGGAAALALAQSPDIQTIKMLQDTAGGDSMAARRAQMALDINRDRLVGEVQP
ncbi:MAG: hypothetical protein QNK19_07405 [Xanthomonadales bacterium]|nr:hypothetical protein [Xanthomonadales bacterium]